VDCAKVALEDAEEVPLHRYMSCDPCRMVHGSYELVHGVHVWVNYIGHYHYHPLTTGHQQNSTS